MSGMRFEDRMSDQDALMWGIEKDPLLRSTITSISVLDANPDRERLLGKVKLALGSIPRLRQRAVSPPLGVAPPRWLVDPNFDLGYHMRFVKASGGSLRDVLDMAAPLAMQGFDRARPLWEFYVVEDLADGKAAMIQKIHHSVTDGVGAMTMAMALLDLERHPATVAPAEEPELPEGEQPTAMELLREGLDHERRRQLGIAQRSVGRAAKLAADPVGTVRGFATLAASMGRSLAPATTPLSPLMSGRSLSVRFETVRVPLAEFKAAAKSVGGTLNDAFVAAVAGGFDRYHRRHGTPVDALRMSMPINIRSSEDGTKNMAGNQFVPARFPVPTSIDDPGERMLAIKALVNEQRVEPALGLTAPMAGVLNRLPLTLTTTIFGSMLKGIDFVTSNVPGAPIPVYMAGAAVEANFPFGPLAGAAVNVTLLSMIDELQIGVNIDPAAVPDPAVLVECLEEGFAEILKLA